MDHVPELEPAPRLSQTQIDGLGDPGFVVGRDCRIVSWNPAATTLLGWSAADAVGATCAPLLQGRSPDGQLCRIRCPRASGLTCPGVTRGGHPNLRVHDITGAGVDVTVVELPILLDDEPALLHIMRPVGEFRRDPLTGLLGRQEVAQALNAAQSGVRRSGDALSAALIDLDHLKRINDRYGHVAGDQALRQVAEVLRAGRCHDEVARWGGDEFLLLAAGANAEETVVRLQRCIATLRTIRPAPRAIPLSISAGVTEVGIEDDLESIVGRTDAALYEAKQQRSIVCIARDPAAWASP